MADGKIKRIYSIFELEVGCIVRPVGMEQSPFSDCLVVKINQDFCGVAHHIKLSRPYAFVSGVGTTSPTVLLGQETFEVDFEKLQKYYELVLTDRGKCHTYVT